MPKKPKAGAAGSKAASVDAGVYEARRRRALAVFEVLAEEYPDAKPLLRFRNAFELLTATVLAAQCTDEMVNKVTEKLFPRFPNPPSLADAEPEELEGMIRSTGFYRNKAKSLLAMAGALVENHGGQVPESVEEMVKLPGVGRKTANVVAGQCFGAPAIIVDTHFKRVSGRLGLTDQTNPDKIEVDVAPLIPAEMRTRFSMVINYHGRYCCAARKPKCPDCPVSDLCPWPEKTKGT